MLIHPGIQFKPVKGNSLGSNRDLDEQGPYFVIEAVTVHAQIGGGIPQPKEAREYGGTG
jgi:hypothetical protein